jgi:hypothetical protein
MPSNRLTAAASPPGCTGSAGRSSTHLELN